MKGERQKIIAEYRERCICDRCPSYNECMNAEEIRLFCVTGKAEHCSFPDDRGCLCKACFVTESLGLKKTYCCIRGDGL